MFSLNGTLKKSASVGRWETKQFIGMALPELAFWSNRQAIPIGAWENYFFFQKLSKYSLIKLVSCSFFYNKSVEASARSREGFERRSCACHTFAVVN